MHRSLLVLTLGLACIATAQEDEKPTDVEGSKDHPAVKRYPGAIITEFSEKDFESFAFPVGDKPDEDAVKSKTVEGKYYAAYLQYPNKVGCTQVRRNYENAFAAAGMTLHRGKAPPHDRGWGGDNLAWVSAEGKVKGKGPELYAVVTCSEDGPMSTGNIYVVEKAAMEQKIELDAGAMIAELEKTGRIALYGINFATGKAEITPDSAKTLAEIASVLNLKKDWKLRVEGHTDNAGKAKANLELSKKRAAAVKDYLVKNLKVDGARLATEGFGDGKPIEPNTTEEGKAKNRRVELSRQ